MRRMPILWEEYTYPKHQPLPKGWLEDEKWANERMVELGRKYPNQWVAVYNKEVVSFGTNLAFVKKVAAEKATDRPAFCFFAKHFGRYPIKTGVSD